MRSLIQRLGVLDGAALFCKREDLLPISFGGNKARKCELFFEEIDRGGYDAVVSYGSGSSNHCRVVSNLCAARGLECELISPAESFESSFNLRMTEWFGARRVIVPVEQVHDTIEARLAALRGAGRKPYFIPGGGHGNLGVQAYVDCFREILEWEAEEGICFDEIYLASGTGTTQAGLICGKLLSGSGTRIVGISIARPLPRGREIVLQSARDYLNHIRQPFSEQTLQQATVFVDKYVGSGYGRENPAISRTISEIMRSFGLPLDGTYTGKAFWGMRQMLAAEKSDGKKLLFLHTGGTPLFFDHLQRIGVAP